MSDNRFYQIRKKTGFLTEYVVLFGFAYPNCHVVDIAYTRRGADRIIEKDKKKRAKPIPPPPDLVWSER